MQKAVVGYRACRSGLNNQKHALLGLLTHAAATSSDMSLPHLINFATDERGVVSELSFGEVFDFDKFISCAHAFGVEVKTGEPVDNVNFHQMFEFGSRVSRERSAQSKYLAQTFWRGLRPSSFLEKRILKLRHEVFEKRGIEAVLQLRIEPDWQNYVSTYMKRIEGEDITTSYETILTKVAKTFQESVATLYITCDEAQVPREDVDTFARESLGVNLIWKSDLDNYVSSQDDLCHRTVIDFEMAVRSRIFIGTTRSTFANTVSMTKVAVSENSNTQDYIYNAPGDKLMIRRDNGIYADYRDAIR